MIINYPRTELIDTKPFFSDEWADISKRMSDYHILLTSMLYDRLVKGKIAGFSAYKEGKMLFFSLSLKKKEKIQCTYFFIKNDKLIPYGDSQVDSLDEMDKLIPDGVTVKTY